MTKRDDYYKTLGRVSTLMGTVKGLGGIPIIQTDETLRKFAASANEAMVGLNERLATLAAAQQEALPLPKPTTKALLLPAAGSKEEFALAALAESMGLTIADVVLPDAKATPVSQPGPVVVAPKPVVSPPPPPPPVAVVSLPPPAPVPDSAIEEAVLKDFGALAQVFGEPVDNLAEDQKIEKILEEEKFVSSPSGGQPTEQEIKDAIYASGGTVTFDPLKDYIENGVIMSKRTGQPKRPYVKSGKFNAQAVKQRADAAKASGRRFGNRYTARRMS